MKRIALSTNHQWHHSGDNLHQWTTSNGLKITTQILNSTSRVVHHAPAQRWQQVSTQRQWLHESLNAQFWRLHHDQQFSDRDSDSISETLPNRSNSCWILEICAWKAVCLNVSGKWSGVGGEMKTNVFGVSTQALRKPGIHKLRGQAKFWVVAGL